MSKKKRNRNKQVKEEKQGKKVKSQPVKKGWEYVTDWP
jgi:hypothetical protein